MSLNTLFTKAIGNESTTLFLVRITLGAIFFAHGAQKVLGWFGGYGLDATAQFFQQGLGIPVALAYLASFTEFLGGIAITVGAFSRVFSLGFTTVMVVAIFEVHLPNGFFMNWGSIAGRGEGFEYSLVLLIMSVAVLLLGPGKYSLDHKLFGEATKADRSSKNISFVS